MRVESILGHCERHALLHMAPKWLDHWTTWAGLTLCSWEGNRRSGGIALAIDFNVLTVCGLKTYEREIVPRLRSNIGVRHRLHFNDFAAALKRNNTSNLLDVVSGAPESSSERLIPVGDEDVAVSLTGGDAARPLEAA